MSSAAANDTIRRSATRLRWAVWLVVGAMTIGYAAGRLGLAAGFVRLESRSAFGESSAALIAADLCVLLLVVAMWRLSQMLGALAAGDLFSARVVRGFRSFAWWLLLFAGVAIVAKWVVGSLPGQAGGPHRIAIALDLSDLLMLGLTLILFLVARLLERARQIEDEMREFV